MRMIVAALLASVALAAPAQAADLSFLFASNMQGVNWYVSGFGKLTIDEASGVNGRYSVTGLSASTISGPLRDNTVVDPQNNLFTAAESNSFITFAADGSVIDYRVGFLNGPGRANLGLTLVGGRPAVFLPGFALDANVSIEGFVPPVVQPPAVPEPATWAMMIGGFGLVGGAMRRRKATVAYA